MSNGEIRNPVEELAEEFMQKRRMGQAPSIEDYARRYSQHADEIRDLFPTLEMMEHIRKDVVEPAAGQTLASSDVGQTLGDFQILREIGRGGMGVVYEAQQISLGRRVALKVLSANLQAKSKYLERFKREAKAAANLQHTNIVPVYGVAEEDGRHFFVMQFIYGRGLDEVFEALSRSQSVQSSEEHSVSADGLANALATGQFFSQDSQIEPTRLLEIDFSSGNGVANSASSNAISSLGQNSGSSETAKQHLSRTGSSFNLVDHDYCRRIAEMGQQAADALAYAHRNGMLHRDIKPGNLLLDVFGNIWITDFGLVKMTGEEGLTETGDIVGTLRYIAPECLKGQFDERSDVYGLGLTLHEMLAREKAFSAVSRGELTQQILEQGPTRLQNVPRDLGTIIQKATSLDAGSRYQSATDFADDLGRFLGSQPIRARRSTSLERLWSWSKRNRRLAASLAACLLLLLAGLASSLAFSYQLNEYAKDRQAAVVAAENESEQAQRRFVEGNIARAQTMAASRTPGQRIKGLEAVRESVAIARKLKMGPETFDGLRTAAISCLTNVDIALVKQWDGDAGTESDVAFNSQLDSYIVQPVNFGPVEVRRVSDQSVIAKLDGRKYWGGKWISADGRFITMTTASNLGSRFHIYEVATGKLVHDLGSQKNWKRSKFQFNRTGDQAAFASADGFVRVYSIGNNDPVFELKSDADCLLFGDPDQLFVFKKKLSGLAPRTGSVLNFFKHNIQQTFAAVFSSLRDLDGEYVAEVYSISSGQKTRTIKLAGEAYSAAFSQGGQLAVVFEISPGSRGKFSNTITNEQKNIEIFDLPSKKPAVRLTHNIRSAQDVSFDETGSVLIVNLNNQLALHDVRTGNRLLVGAGKPLATDGQKIVCDQLGKFCIYDLVLSDVYRGLVAKKTHNATRIDPLEQFMVSPDADALRFFEIHSGKLLAQFDNYPCGYARITPDGKNLFVSTKPARQPRTIHRWPISRDDEKVAIGPPEVVEIAKDFVPQHLAMDSAGKLMASVDYQRSKIGIRFLQQDRDPVVISGPDPRPRTLMFVAVSNDQRWAATGTWHGDGCAIYDIEKGQVVYTNAMGRTSVQFTQDSRYLICNGYAVELGSWNEFDINQGDKQMRFLFGFLQPSNSGSAFLAMNSSFGRVAVMDTQDLSILAKIQINNRSTISLSSTTKDGRLLIVDQYDNDKEFLALLDIAKLRKRLKALDLDWGAPDIPEFEAQPSAREIVVVGQASADK